MASLTLLLLGFPALSHAQSDRYPLEIKRAQLGLPAGAKSGQNDQAGGKQNLFKAGSFAPVWVWVDCKREYDKPLFLSVETTDADETSTVSTVPLPRLQPGDSRTGYELGVIPYLKPGSNGAELSVNIRDASGRDYAEPYRKSAFSSSQTATTILSIGASLNGFRLTGSKAPDGSDNVNDAIRNGWVELAQCIEANQLPDNWLGYKGVDLVILATGSDSNDYRFFTRLAAEKARLAALREWVMRGGRLLVSVGTNPEILSLIPEIRDILPATIAATSKTSVDSLRLRWLKSDLNENLNFGDEAGGKISITKLESRPDRPYQIVMPWSDRAAAHATPLMVEGSFGAGRVFVAAFDIEKAPLSGWKERDKFWEGLFPATGMYLQGKEDSQAVNRYMNNDSEAFAARFHGSLDFFEGVPVVSFGWVAMFILLYILLIGPVDYYILKKVFGRLEWTWITFPLIVVAVSALAYYAAYAIKGRDMKINKIDLVHIDLATKRAYGHTWFSIFSPRIQNYNVGLEPRQSTADSPAWTSASGEESSLATALSWTGTSRGGRESLLRKSYDYLSSSDPVDGRLRPATGLQNVPIQVWSTKAFEGEWMVPLAESRPLIEAELRRAPGDAGVVLAKIRSNLPIEKLEDVHLIYMGKDYPLDVLVRGEERTLTMGLKDTNAGAENWLKGDSQIDAIVQPGNRRSNSSTETTPVFRLWPFLFHDLMYGTQVQARNAGFRSLDQSWRADRDHGSEAILVGRVKITEGPAEEWSNQTFSPTRLWLNGHPGQKDAGNRPVERKPLLGTLRQDTTVIVTIPVQDARK